MNYFEKLEFKKAEKLKVLLNEYNLWLKENVTIKKLEELHYKETYEDYDNFHIKINKFFITIKKENNRKIDVIKQLKEFNLFNFKPKAFLFLCFIIKKRFKYNSNENELTFAITKNARLFSYSENLYYYNLKNGKFFIKIDLKNATFFKDVKKDFNKKIRKDILDDEEIEVYTFNYNNSFFVIFKNRDLILYKNSFINSYGTLKITNKEEIKFLKEIFLNEQNIKDIYFKNNKLFFIFKDFILYLDNLNQVQKIENVNADDIGIYKNGILYKEKKEDFNYSFKDFNNNEYKNMFYYNFFDNLKLDFNYLSFSTRNKLFILKNNFKTNIYFTITDFDERLYNNNQINNIILIGEHNKKYMLYSINKELYILSLKFLSKYKKENSLKFEKKEILEKESINNIMLLNL